MGLENLDVNKVKLGKLKKFGVIMSVVSIVGVVLATVFFTLRQIEKQRRIEVEEQLQVTIEAKRVVETKLEEEKRRAKILAKELAEEKQRRQIISARLDEAEEQLKGERKHRAELEKNLEEMEGELSLARKAKDEIEAKFKEIQTRSTKVVNLGKIVVAAKAALKGKVLVVNREFEFIVVNLGSKDNLEMGAVLAVYRENNLIGRAKVEKVYENMSAATILHELRWDEISEGDIVKVYN